MVRIIHIGDTHIGVGRKNSYHADFGRVKRNAIKQNFKQVIAACNQQAVDLLLIAGDFWEGEQVEYNDVLDIFHLLNQLQTTEVVVISGNHDCLSVTGAYHLPNWGEHVRIVRQEYEVVRIERLDTAIIASSWVSNKSWRQDQAQIQALLPEMDLSYRIGLFHGDIKPSDYYYMDLDFLIGLKLDYIGLGHIHKQEFVRDNIAYCGCLEALDFSEPYSTGYILVEIGKQARYDLSPEWRISNNNDKTIATKPIASNCCPIRVLVLSLETVTGYLELIGQVVAFIKQQCRPNEMVRCILEGEIDRHLRLEERQLNQDIAAELGAAVAYIEVVNQLQPNLDIDLIYQEHQTDIIGYFIDAMRRQEDTLVNQKALKVGVKLLLEQETDLTFRGKHDY